MADTPPIKLRMGEITAGEARARYAANPVVLLPLGSHEDHGPHAPMGDYLLAERMAEAIARRAVAAGTDCVVAPVLPFGRADFFAPMPGGIALSTATFRAVLEEVLECLLRHGLTRIVVLNGHGGNMEPIREATRAVWQTRRVLIPCLYLWRIAASLLPAIAGPERAKAALGHGADPLTSLALHLLPEAMRPDLLPPPRTGKPPLVLGLPQAGWGLLSFEGAEVAVPLDYDAMSPDGIGPGDPHLAGAATGAALAEALSSLGARFVVHFAAQCRAGPAGH
ncbi:MAG: creatininase family protein [Acetobacteraceae bacterium]|nr:creatininase family protein [Acetobacteraceae bacterium]MDW8397080.1 creatininase family protein [Acetobacteraceae bacterium]